MSQPGFDAAPGFDASPARADRLAESEPALVERLRAEIAAAGPITFARFMELALTDPGHGYYTAAAARPTREGDFLTAPEMHPIFGRTLARTVDDAWRLLGEPADFTLREYGAGSGALGLGILQELGRISPDLAARIRFEPVEVNPHRRAECAERFEAAGLADRVALEPAAGPMTGLVLANEYLDALPVHRVQQEAGRLRELFVGWSDGWFADVVADPSSPALAERLAANRVTLEDGQEGEICLALDAWAEAIARDLERGIVLVIDYGHEAAELYSPRRRRGTLLAYAEHRVEEDPYRRVGRQDLTAHVDVTALIRAGEAAGLTTLGSTTQAELLVGSGLGDLLEAARTELAADEAGYLLLRSSVMRLLDPRATGGFRAVVFGRDLPPDTALKALSFRLPERRRWS